MTAPTDLYPLTTQDGQAIPNDVIKPLALVSFAILEGASNNITIPADYTLVWVYATKACLLKIGASDLPAPLVAGTSYANTTLIPAESPMVMMVAAGAADVQGVGPSDGVLYMMSIVQWAGLHQVKQSSVQ